MEFVLFDEFYDIFYFSVRIGKKKNIFLKRRAPTIDKFLVQGRRKTQLSKRAFKNDLPQS